MENIVSVIIHSFIRKHLSSKILPQGKSCAFLLEIVCSRIDTEIISITS